MTAEQQGWPAGGGGLGAVPRCGCGREHDATPFARCGGDGGFRRCDVPRRAAGPPAVGSTDEASSLLLLLLLRANRATKFCSETQSRADSDIARSEVNSNRRREQEFVPHSSLSDVRRLQLESTHEKICALDDRRKLLPIRRPGSGFLSP
jgi:hypothetical protein